MRKKVDEKVSDYGFDNYDDIETIDEVVKRDVWIEQDFNKKDIKKSVWNDLEVKIKKL